MDYKLTIYILNQDIRIYVHSNRPNGWTEWADFFCHRHRRALQPVLHICDSQNKSRNYQVFKLNTVPGVD